MTEYEPKPGDRVTLNYDDDSYGVSDDIWHGHPGTVIDIHTDGRPEKEWGLTVPTPDGFVWVWLDEKVAGYHSYNMHPKNLEPVPVSDDDIAQAIKSIQEVL